MLRVSVHSSDATGINVGNQLAQLDIAYAKLGPIADYVVGIAIRGVGEVTPDKLVRYAHGKHRQEEFLVEGKQPAKARGRPKGWKQKPPK